jgi:menaquinone-dependent protoporphyrinogen IX oxidase
MESARKPKVLFVYHSFTHQAEKVVKAISSVLEERGCETDRAPIELTDRRYRDRFAEFPFRRPFLTVVGMIPAELRRKPAEIGIPENASRGDYDLVVVGSPTWWLSTNVPIRSYLELDESAGVLADTPFAAFVVCRRYWKHNLKTVRRLGTKRGGEYVDGIHFAYPGGQVRSLLSLISYLGSGEYRDRFLGVKIPPTNLQPEHLDQAREFATKLADGLVGAKQPRA